MTRTALFLSPHLDDVAFSCGGLAALLHDRGWHTVLATAFTATVMPATGFALACQLDKGLSPDVDYMALRRVEDREAAAILGFSELLHLDLPEAPHRGYTSARALFGPLRDDDPIMPSLAAKLAHLQHAFAPDLVLVPQGLGAHVDHLQMVRAAYEALSTPIGWYRDTPYAIRHPDAHPQHTRHLAELQVPIGAALDRKLRAACAYSSQIGFQFGGPEQTSAALRDFARAESGNNGFAERVMCSDQARSLLSSSHPIRGDCGDPQTLDRKRGVIRDRESRTL